MQTSLPEQWANAILKELNQHKGKVVVCFAFVICIVVIAGFLWPKKYEASTIVFADDQNIIKPLLAGQAEVTRLTENDQLLAVQQRITSNNIMEQVLLEAKLVDNINDKYSLQPKIRALINGLKIDQAGRNRIKISFRDKDASKAYIVTSAITNVFIRDSARTKREESGEAYTFIDNQVKTYKDQLQSAEDKLKEFRTANPGASDGTGSNRVGDFRTSIESLTLDLQVARARRNELAQQISHEGQFIAQSYKADVYRNALTQAQAKLDTLRLSYQETYPDIVSLKQQIEDLRRSITQAEGEPSKGNDRSSAANPVYQKIKSDLSDAEVNVKTLELKLDSSRRMLDGEMSNSKQNAEYQAQLAELSRDYNVTKQIYEDLLERKEKARMSVALDVQGQGLNYRIQEPPVFPTAPVGLRFIHFYLAAPILGFLIPIGLLIAYIQLDPRVRFVDRMELVLPASVQVIMVVPHMSTSMAKRMARAEWNYLAIFIAVVLAAYAIVAVVRLSGLV
ncbi:MAG: hypothetical protein JWM78_3163 [Verrucomicrobiaceae bacterium]|nr:hypothetical protein [Verrucomicrobiaceae bacterium]